MEYRHVNGPVYCRYALTPPVINSALGHRLGIVAPCELDMQAGSHRKLEAGTNVKLRMELDNRTTRMTCHAKIDWVRRDESTGSCNVAFSHLSLSDNEFQVLHENFTDETQDTVEFVSRVRDAASDLKPVIAGDGSKEVTRAKAVTLPVSLIEEVDEKRGDVPFSEFVANSLREYLKDW
ncbi:MAG: hypothetical protein P8182_20600 [Deltaproteobacteria bacterium]